MTKLSQKKRNMRMSRAKRSAEILETASKHKKDMVKYEQDERCCEIMQKIANHVRGSKTDGWERSVKTIENIVSHRRDILSNGTDQRNSEMLKMITDDRMESIREDMSYNLLDALENKRITTDIFKEKEARMAQLPGIGVISEAIIEDSGIDISYSRVEDIFDDGEWMKSEKYSDFIKNLNSIGVNPKMDFISNYMGLVEFN